MFKKFQALISGGKKVYDTISSVGPKVNKTKLDEAKSKLAKTIQKGKATSAKLKQTQFEIKNPQFKGKDFTFATTKKKTLSNTEKAKLRNDESKKAFKASEGKTKHFYAPKNFNKGGRVGLKGGADAGKIPTTPKEKKFAAIAEPKNRITYRDKIEGAKKRG